jgi:hypothetical protein
MFNVICNCIYVEIIVVFHYTVMLNELNYIHGWNILFTDSLVIQFFLI